MAKSSNQDQGPQTPVNRWFSGTLLVGTMAMLVLIVILSRGVGASRTIVVSAITDGMEIDFAGHSEVWDLNDVWYCVPLEKRVRSIKRGNGLCDPRGYDQKQGTIAIHWDDGASVKLWTTLESGWVLKVSGQAAPVDGTLIHLPETVVAKLGALSFSGAARIGEVAGSRETNLLISGSYDIREKPLFSSATETIKSGDFRRGEKVEVLNSANKESPEERVYGYLLPTSDDGQKIEVTLVSEPGEAIISVNYFGSRVPISIAPNWIDRSLASPFILALSVLLPIALTLIQIIVSTNGHFDLLNLSRLISRLRFRR